MATPLENIRNDRIKKLDELKKMGINPYPSKVDRTHKTKQVLDDFEKLQKSKETITLAGRIMSLRRHGKMAFIDIQDDSGKIQIFVSKKDVGDKNYDAFKLFDMGDFLEVSGIAFVTKAGENTIQASELKILSKSLRALPDKHFGIKNEETKTRQRYLESILEPEKKWRFEKTAQITFAIREFLNGKGFLEINTPILQAVYGGTNAEPFKTHVNALHTDYYLAIAHEIYLKKLITAGFENVFTIGRCFRNENTNRGSSWR